MYKIILPETPATGVFDNNKGIRAAVVACAKLLCVPAGKH